MSPLRKGILGVAVLVLLAGIVLIALVYTKVIKENTDALKIYGGVAILLSSIVLFILFILYRMNGRAISTQNMPEEEYVHHRYKPGGPMIPESNASRLNLPNNDTEWSDPSD